MKPKIFIGSSVEGLKIAKTIQAELDYEVEATIWNQGVFNPSNYALEDLIRQTKENEFAIFIFTPDDEVIFRKDTKNVVRDNVIFELGLFIGALGRSNVFFLKPRGIDIHIPTDLAGVTPGDYESKRSDNNIQAAIGPFCSQIMKIIEKTGPMLTFKKIRDFMDKINPEINNYAKANKLKLHILLNQERLIELTQIKGMNYFSDFLNYEPNGTYVSNAPQRTNSLHDGSNTAQTGYNLYFTEKYTESFNS